MTKSSPSRAFIALLAACASAALFTGVPLAARQQAAASHARASHTALDRYVSAPDSSYAWKVVRELPAEGATATLLEMTSQRWLTEQEVERPLWTHWITVVRPAPAAARGSANASSGEASPKPLRGEGGKVSDVALLFITGGSLDREPPARPSAWLLDAARDTGTVTAELRLVPNQPVVFKDDPAKKKRSEDDFIAYTWDKYLA